MCESNVYLVGENGKEKLIFEAVDKIMPFGGGLCLENIFYKRKYIKARIKEVSISKRRVVLESIVDLAENA